MGQARSGRGGECHDRHYALRLDMALAIACGVPLVAGIITAVEAGFVASATDGSTYQITGLAAAFIRLVAGIAQKHGLGSLAVCTVIAAFLFIKRVSENTEVIRDIAERDRHEDFHPLPEDSVPSVVMVYLVAGAFMFGAAEKLENLLRHSHEEPKVLILRMRRVISMDSAAVNSIEAIHRKIQCFFLTSSHAHRHPRPKLGFVGRIGIGQFHRKKSFPTSKQP